MKILINNLVTEYEDVYPNSEAGREGKTILMLHGWGVNLHSFDKITEILKQKYRIIRLDLPGFGATDIPKNWSLENYINFVSEFMAKLNIKPNVLLGHSFGGRIIIKGLGSGKLNTEKIILISPAGVSLFNLKKNIVKVISKIGKLLLYIPPIYFWKESIRNKFYKIIGSEYMDNTKMKEIFGSVVSEDLKPYAENIKNETLLIWGWSDYVTPLSDGEFLNKVLQNSKLEIIKYGGHFSFIEKSEEVAEKISKFVG